MEQKYILMVWTGKDKSMAILGTTLSFSKISLSSETILFKSSNDFELIVAERIEELVLSYIRNVF